MNVAIQQLIPSKLMGYRTTQTGWVVSINHNNDMYSYSRLSPAVHAFVTVTSHTNKGYKSGFGVHRLTKDLRVLFESVSTGNAVYVDFSLQPIYSRL